MLRGSTQKFGLVPQRCSCECLIWYNLALSREVNLLSEIFFNQFMNCKTSLEKSTHIYWE